MKASNPLYRYSEGVLAEPWLHCSSRFFNVNHGVVIVGYGEVNSDDTKVRGRCKEYWIIRNSWGADWGEDGFFRMCMDGAGSIFGTPYGTCLINKYATWPNFDGEFIEP
jgi:hypothetical protein